ncbi:Protein LSD1 [Glycine max]|nr:Protein LSD1 [Glycine max]
MRSQLVCNGCRSILVYPRGATNVCCALCNTITSVPPPGMDMSQLYCGGCTTLLMYTRGATSVRCSCCHTINLVPVQIVCTKNIHQTISSSNSGQTYIVPNFRTFLYILLLATCYASTDSLVLGKCSADKEKLVCATFDIELMLSAINFYCECCHQLTELCNKMTNGRLSIPVQRPNGTANSGTVSSTSSSMPYSQSQTVVVENPMSVDSSGKLVRNVVVGVTTDKK